jgi:threonine synthase
MKLYSTKNKDHTVGLAEAVFRGLPMDNGLYMPEFIPALGPDFWTQLPKWDFPKLALEVSRALIGDTVAPEALKKLVYQAMDFPVPLVQLDDDTAILELFHGPTLAFKDFGARFMAGLMGYFNQGSGQDLLILVATSGDTGGAVAAGFHQVPGVQVVVLYPTGKVSPLQEKQLTTLGGNIHALEIDGDFDACQALVKLAFLDVELQSALRLSSANSINIARLIPQSFYYFEAYRQAASLGRPLVFSVPSGNYGNLTAGLLARRMGLPMHHFLAASNANDVVPRYLNTGTYTPEATIPTLSNAMDVGSPSNFARMMDLYGSTWNHIKDDVSGYSFSDEQVRRSMKAVYSQYGYVLDPHTAVGYLAWQAYNAAQPNQDKAMGVVLSTAHPAKFLEVVEDTLGQKVDIPERLARLRDLAKRATKMSANFPEFKSWLLNGSTWNQK